MEKEIITIDYYNLPSTGFFDVNKNIKSIKVLGDDYSVSGNEFPTYKIFIDNDNNFYFVGLNVNLNINKYIKRIKIHKLISPTNFIPTGFSLEITY